MAAEPARKHRSRAFGLSVGVLAGLGAFLTATGASAADSDATELRLVVETALP